MKISLKRTALVLGMVAVTQTAVAAIDPIDVFEEDRITQVVIGPISPTAGDLILAPGSGVLIDGTGQLIVDAGSLLSADALRNNGINILQIDQAGSTLQIGDEINLGLGSGIDGSLTITNGALVNIGGGTEAGFIGSGLNLGDSGGVGTATINNATLTIDRNLGDPEARLTVGRGGTGTLQIENGATVTIQDASGQLGIGDGVTVAEASPGLAASGVVNVDGAGTNLVIDSADVGALIVAVSANGVDSAIGTVSVTNGGTIDITGTGGNSGINVARGGNTTGLIEVTGPGSTINVVGPQGVIGVAVDFGGEVGDGTGTFRVTDQGAVNVSGLTPGNGFFGIGQGTGNGLLEVTTGGTVNVDGDMPISVTSVNNTSQSGTVSITNGGIVNANRVLLGNRGNINIDGAGSVYNIGDDISIGLADGGISNLSVTNGALLNIGNGTEIGFPGSGLNIGRGPATGIALIDNASVVIDRNLDDGEVRVNVGRSGTGVLTIQNGATFLVQDESGEIGFRGDGISVGEATPTFQANGQLTVQGAGTVLTIDTADSGFLAAGISANGIDSAVGVIDILDGAVVNITGTGANSGVNLARGGNSQGTLNLSGAGSRLNVQGVQGFVAVASDVFGEIGDGDGLLRVTDQAELNISGLTPGQGFLQVGLGTGNGVVEINTDATVNVDGFVLISDASATNNSQTGVVTVNDTGVLNAIAIGVGDRGVLQGTGTINAERLSIFSGGTVNLDTLEAFSEVNVTGGTYDTTQAFNLGVGADQTLTISDGGQIDAVGNSQIGAATNISSLTLNDANSQFTTTGTATVNTTIAVNSGASFFAQSGIEVGNQGFLSGDGGSFVASTININGGGTLSPGNSPGILNITGDLNLNGGDLLFEIAGNQTGEFDVINVDGDVSLNSGNVNVSVLNGYNTAGQNFDVLTATGAYAQDASVNFTSLGAGPDFEFSTRNQGGITIGTINFLAFDIGTIPTLTTNQRSLAGHLDALCPQIENLGNQTANQLDLDLRCGGIRNGSNSPAQIATALDAISPDEIFGTFQSLLNFTTIQHGNLARRLNGLRNGATNVDLRNIDIKTDDVSVSGEELQEAVEELLADKLDRWGFFSDGRINFGDRDDASSLPGFEFDTVSITLGTDYRFRDNLVFGAALGYSQVNADFDAGGGIDVDNFALSLLGTYYRGSSFYVDVLASYGWSDLDTDRRIQYQDTSGVINRKASGSTDSNQTSVGVGTGFDFNKGRWVFGPHLGVNYSNTMIDGYNEEGALGLNLSLPDTAVRSVTANMGFHASLTTTSKWGVFVPYARLDYVRELKDNAETAKIRFANDPINTGSAPAASPFRVRSANPDNDYLVWSVGLHAQFIRGFAAFADYRAIEGLEDMQLGEVTFGMRYETKF